MTIGLVRNTAVSDEHADWSAPPSAAARTMIRSETELALERFFEEMSPEATDCMTAISAPASSQLSSSRPDDGDDEVVAIEKPHRPPADFPSMARIDSDEYHRFLKNKLAMECAAVARTLESSMKSGESLQIAEDLVPRHAQLGIHVGGQAIVGTGPAISQPHNETPCGSIGISALPDVQNKQVRQTSESSREESDYELERDTETTGDAGPQDEKRARRMLSNRESARRSRRRKQVLLSELETQAEQLRNEKKELLERQNSCDRKYSDAAVEHRILNAQIEALRAKVKMSEERVKQVSGGYNPPFQAVMPKPLSMAIPPITVPVEKNPDQAFHHSTPTIGTATTHQPIFKTSFPSNSPASFSENQHNNGVGNIIAEPSGAMQRVEKQIRAGASPSQAMPGWHMPPEAANPHRHK